MLLVLFCAIAIATLAPLFIPFRFNDIHDDLLEWQCWFIWVNFHRWQNPAWIASGTLLTFLAVATVAKSLFGFDSRLCVVVIVVYLLAGSVCVNLVLFLLCLCELLELSPW